MTTSGWVFMLVSNTFVWGLAAWCYCKVLTVNDETAPSE